MREEERKKKMETEGWRGSAAKLCLSLFFSAFLPFFFSSFPPIYKSINVRSYVLCHCSVFKSLKRGRCLCNWQNWRCAAASKSPVLKVAWRKKKKKKGCTKASDRKAVNKSGYPRMSGDEVSH